MVPWRPHNIVILGAGLVTTVLSPLSPPLANEVQLREVLCGVTEPNMCACVSAVWGSLTASGSNTLHHTFVIGCLSAGGREGHLQRQGISFGSCFRKKQAEIKTRFSRVVFVITALHAQNFQSKKNNILG